MARTIVISNADFSVNKLDTVTYTEATPCARVTLDKSSSTFSHIGDTVTLTATALPADTTDTIMWSTNNPDVVFVAGGVVTAVGCGDAVITVRCGTQTAMCNVVVEHVAAIKAKANTYYGKSDTYPYAQGGALTGYARVYSETGTRYALYNAKDEFPIPFPKGAKNIRINCQGLYPYGFWASATEGWQSGESQCKVFGNKNFTNDGTPYNSRNVIIPDATGDYAGMNAVLMVVRNSDKHSVTDAELAGVTVTFTA